MKKRAIVLLAFTAALTAVSCQKEAMKEAEITPTGEGMTISAVTEGIGADVKADLAYKYDVIWRTGDKICVKNSEKSVEFTLVNGAGTTKGTFSSTGGNISGEVEGFYPASVADLIWPAEQQNNHVPPMYCKKNLSSTQNQTFNFASLGSVLQLNFNSTTAGIVLKSIEVKADEAMSGAFTINEEGKAVISQPEGDKPGITLDLGEGVTLGTSAKKFNIAVPAGEYHGLSIVLTATNGKKCTINAKKDKAIEMVFNTVNTLAVSGEFKPDLPAGALPGVFSVSATKKVHFSKGNLYYDGSNWGFEAEQYYFRTYNGKGKCDANGYSTSSGTASGHWGLFGWSTAGKNFGMNTSTSTDAYSGNFLDWGTTIDNKGTWKTLSGGADGEWKYLFDHHVNVWGTCNSVPGRFIAPDGFVGDASALSEAIKDWESAQADGIVFLPAAGSRGGSTVVNVGGYGLYWSSTAYDSSCAYGVYVNSIDVGPVNYDYRSGGYGVRLITESK